MSLKNEEINKQYESLYLEVPREIKCNKDDLDIALNQLKQESEENLFNVHGRYLADAVMSKRDFLVANEFHKKCLASFADKTKRKYVFTLLQAVSLTNSVMKIEGELLPHHLFEEINLDDRDELLCFLKYTINHLNEIVGMQIYRENSKNYDEFLQKVCAKYDKDDEITVNAIRCYYAIARCATPNQLTGPFLQEMEEMLLQRLQYQQGSKFQQIAFNLLCGIIGRMSITLVNDQPSRGNAYKLHLKDVVKLEQLTLDSVCVNDLKTYLQSGLQAKKEDDDMF